MNELALFAGAGGGILGGLLHGWRTVAAVEIEDYPRRVLLQRQADGILPRFPIWDDVRTFDGKPWRGKVDVISGGFPCQDISSAGKGAGIDGARSGLWSEMARIIREVRPRFVFVENSPMLTVRGLGVVLGDLAALGYDARWGVLGARDVGAPHKRDRMWVLAYAKCEQDNSERRLSERRRDSLGWGEKATFCEDGEASSDCIDGQGESEDLADADKTRLQGRNSGREGGENLRTQTGGQLNPSWVETLMAWPKDWTCLDPMNLADYKKWLRGFVYEKAQNEKETLRGVREADGKAAVWGAPRGSWGMEPQEVLQSLMCEHSKVYNEIGLALAGAEVSERAMRVLRDTAAATGSPLGRELQEYSDNELADFVRVVSQVYPSYGRQAWASGTWEATHPRVATGIAHRVDRLKAIGNGQVPAVAALAWQILGGPVETEAAPSEPGAASNETSADIAPAAGR